jgi:hypothetical protein
MGRPLNKKYFGNRNQGTGGYQVTGNLSNSQNYADDRIGGEGILSITAAPEAGDVLINSSYPAPTLVKPAPKIPGGVTSTSRVIWEVDRVALTSGGSGYEHNGDLPVNATFTGLGGGVVASVASVGAGPGYPATTAGINFTGAGANRGEFIDTPPTAALTYEVCTPGNPTGGADNAQAQVFFRVKRIEVLTPGSGYAGTETFSWNTAGCSGSPFPDAPTFALTVDTGAVGSATNQENAIIIHANTIGEGALVGDVIKQVSTRRYKVKTTDGIETCKLVANSNPAKFQAYMVATATGGTYYVTKLTAHRATLVAKTGDEALDGMSVQWTLGAYTDTIVQIENA